MVNPASVAACVVTAARAGVASEVATEAVADPFKTNFAFANPWVPKKENKNKKDGKAAKPTVSQQAL